MKFLCCCALGNSRSVGMAYLLKCLGHEAIAIGSENTTPETKAILCAWADKIVLVDRRYAHLYTGFEEKILPWYIDTDPYFQGYHPELLGLCAGYYQESDLTPALPNLPFPVVRP